MAKKSAIYADYELRVEDNGKIVILNAGEAVQNAKGAIRTIASAQSFLRYLLLCRIMQMPLQRFRLEGI